MEASTSALSGLIDIIIRPTKALVAADKAPKRMWLPFLLALAIPVFLSLYYLSVVDLDWMYAHDAKTLIDGGEKILLGTLMIICGVGTIISMSLLMAITALYLRLVAKFTSEDNRPYFSWFSLSVWVNVPGTLAYLLMIFFILGQDTSRMGFNELAFFSLNALVMHYPTGTNEAEFFSGLTPFLLWVVALLGHGIKVWTGNSYFKSFVVALVPYGSVYGAGAIMVL